MSVEDPVLRDAILLVSSTGRKEQMLHPHMSYEKKKGTQTFAISSLIMHMRTVSFYNPSPLMALNTCFDLNISAWGSDAFMKKSVVLSSLKP